MRYISSLFILHTYFVSHSTCSHINVRRKLSKIKQKLFKIQQSVLQRLKNFGMKLLIDLPELITKYI